MAGYTSDADFPHQPHYNYMTKKENVQHVRDKVKTATQRLTDTHDSGKVDTMTNNTDIEVSISITYDPQMSNRPYGYKITFPAKMRAFFHAAGFTTSPQVAYEGYSQTYLNAWEAKVAAEGDAARLIKRYGKYLEGMMNSQTYTKKFTLN